MLRVRGGVTMIRTAMRFRDGDLCRALVAELIDPDSETLELAREAGDDPSLLVGESVNVPIPLGPYIDETFALWPLEPLDADGPLLAQLLNHPSVRSARMVCLLSRESGVVEEAGTKYHVVSTVDQDELLCSAASASFEWGPDCYVFDTTDDAREVINRANEIADCAYCNEPIGPEAPMADVAFPAHFDCWADK
jgi:hypothetical protein